MKEYPAWGVDVTAVAVRGVKLDKGPEGRPRLVAWDLVDFTEQVEDVTSIARHAVMARGLYHFRARHALRRARVWTSLRAETAFNRTVTVPPVSDESLDKILEYEAQQQVPFPLDEVYWDRRVLAIRESGEVVATIFAIRKSLIEDRLRKLRKVNLPVDGIQLRPVALQNFCAFERLLENGTIVIDLDYGGLQILFHHDDQTWFRVLPMGAGDLVTLLAQTFQVPHPVAVRMASGDLPPPDAERFEACRRKIAQDIVDEISRTVRYYLAARPHVRPSGIVLFESHPCVPPISTPLKRDLELTVFKPKGFRQLDVDPDVVTAGIQENFPALAKAAGLALQGIGKAEVEVRLFPLELGRELGVRRIGYAAAAVILFLTVAIATWRYGRAERTLDDAANAARAAVAQAGTRDHIERTRGPERPLGRLAQYLAAAERRARPILVVDRVYEMREIEISNGGDTNAPQVVVLRVSAAETGELVLAMLESAAPAEIDEALDRFAEKIPDGDVITGVIPQDAWTASAPAAQPEAQPAGKPLRWRFRHRKYTLDLGKGGS